MTTKKSGLDMTNKLTIYKTIVRPIVTYTAPVWYGISDTQMTRLGGFQNEYFRLITGQNRYARIADMVAVTGLETVWEHVNRLSKRFYLTRLQQSLLTRNLLRDGPKAKHQPAYHRLEIYDMTKNN
ncbi:hypothetical protein Zmor_000645 [Zophobas morio]|uniref:Uncharacterized protein n=1 Tax=Zophobas morio TaxID=2755281 RepID=A0AA38J0E7_9CUCU|nr:hypothetical protein Zmor_000645 [Zophobas morio]